MAAIHIPMLLIHEILLPSYKRISTDAQAVACCVVAVVGGCCTLEAETFDCSFALSEPAPVSFLCICACVCFLIPDPRFFTWRFRLHCLQFLCCSLLHFRFFLLYLFNQHRKLTRPRPLDCITGVLTQDLSIHQSQWQNHSATSSAHSQTERPFLVSPEWLIFVSRTQQPRD